MRARVEETARGRAREIVYGNTCENAFCQWRYNFPTSDVLTIQLVCRACTRIHAPSTSGHGISSQRSHIRIAFPD